MAQAPAAAAVPNGESPETEFEEIIDELAKTSHGSKGLERLRAFFETRVRKTKARGAFLRDRLIQPPIKWFDVQERVWKTAEERNANQFSFLQGDIVNSKLVLGVDGARYEHNLWMIMSADCDCVRGKFVRVAPVLPVDESVSIEKQTLAFALKFANERSFPIPHLPDDDSTSPTAYVANLEEPAHLCFGDDKNGERSLVTQRASLTEAAWHILNAVLLHQITRANMEEALRIRRNGAE
ncbi:MAG: hypothetical protein AAF432_05975 [Planctomycetota bacterium]